jgi:hypothetical protein
VDDIGHFNPYAEDKDDKGMVGSRKDTIYTDIDCYTDRLATYHEDPATRKQVDKQLITLWPILLTGTALYW